MELLVVVGIIILLIGLLIPALSAVRRQSRYVQTQTLMKELGAAADSFFLQVQRYPGVLPERQLNDQGNEYYRELSCTENALAELMGGLEPSGSNNEDQFRLAGRDFYRYDIGRGSTINAIKYDAFFKPKAGDLYYVRGQGDQDDVQDNSPDGEDAYPDLIDAWGTPIIFWRSSGEKPQGLNSGRMVSMFSQVDRAATFYIAGMFSYTGSEALRVGRAHDLATKQGGNEGVSLLRPNSPVIIDLAQRIAEHPTLTETPRGSYVIMSAGPDNYYCHEDELRNSSDLQNDRNVLEQFDDIFMWGGS